MKIVVDTNIVFNAIISGKGNIGDILFNSSRNYFFFLSQFMIEEISKYSEKLSKASKLPYDKLNDAKQRVLSQITLISEEIILAIHWKDAFELMKDIDVKDTPFVALAFEMDALLWTGDKKLSIGLKMLGYDFCKSTEEILIMRQY